MQIYESLVTHRRGEIFVRNGEEVPNIFGRQVCLFAIIGERTHEVNLSVVDDRTAPTLEAIMTNHLARGGVVHSDGWAAYNQINFAAMVLNWERHVHAIQNGLIRDFQHANLVEGLWFDLQHYIRSIYVAC